MVAAPDSRGGRLARIRLEVTEDPRRVVCEGYDRIGSAYASWILGHDRSPARLLLVTMLLEGLPAGARVLDLGCGPGVRTQRLAERFQLLGVDASWQQLREARRRWPQVPLIQADMTRLAFVERSFDAVVAFFSIVHVPREEHASLFGRIAAWLRPGGCFVASLGTSDDPGGTAEDWLGARMYWSGYDAETNIRLLREAGLTIEVAEALEEPEDDDGATFLWVVASRRPERT